MIIEAFAQRIDRAIKADLHFARRGGSVSFGFSYTLGYLNGLHECGMISQREVDTYIEYFTNELSKIHRQKK